MNQLINCCVKIIKITQVLILMSIVERRRRRCSRRRVVKFNSSVFLLELDSCDRMLDFKLKCKSETNLTFEISDNPEL